MEDVEAYDEVKENLQKVDINWEQYDLIDNNGNSETMSSNFNDLAKVSEMMILVISVASFVILALLKKTAHELGKCVVVVTHSKHLAEEADEILEIKNGAISFLSE